MSFPRNRESAPVKETADAFYSRTRELLVDAARDRDEPKLRRAAIRIDGARFNSLSDARQEELLMLFAAAMSATGALAP